jgi:formylglycine-generating enzyme required for sulfatase activity
VGYVRVEAGSFTMGSPGDERGRDGDETQHRVTITRPFLMKVTEVTQAEWQAVLGGNPSDFAGCPSCPVETVSWYESAAYCNALSLREGLEHCYQDAGGAPYDAADAASEVTPRWPRGLACPGYRLPTEAEWEYAARAGTQTAFHTGALLGDPGCGAEANLDRAGWYCGNSGDTTHPVGQKAANAWGLYDMHGNVWEWCWDWYADYPAGPVSDPVGPQAGSSRVGRGGSWSNNARNARSANRNFVAPGGRSHDLGLRPSRSIP